MKLKMSLLSAAILPALALVALPAFAGEARPAMPAAKAAAAARAQALLDGAGTGRVHRAVGDEFSAQIQSVIIDDDGTEHVRFNRVWSNGLPVIGGDFVVHARGGKLVGISQTLDTARRPAGTRAAFGRSYAVNAARGAFGLRVQGTPSARQVVYARGGIEPVLAHEVVLRGMRSDQTPTEMHYIVSALDGRLLDKWDAIHVARPGRDKNTCATGTPASGTGHGITVGTVSVDTADCGSNYQLKDLVRGGGSTNNMGMRTAGMGTVFADADNVWGNGAVSSSQSAGAEAHYGIATTWDYFLDEHGRLGIADDGVGAVARVHYGRNYVNAFWSDACFCMTFGDGDNGVNYYPLTVLDVAAHEMTHGVTSRTANLIYSGESGGLNEATSDIFAAMVEYYANNASDPGDYLIGEEFIVGNPGNLALRYMFKPSLDGRSYDCYVSGMGSDDVHYTSGVANHFFYLLAEGAVVPAGFGAGTADDLSPADLVCNGNTALTGIGREKAGKIWYRALTVYMTSSTNYAQARTATIQAATDLYGNTSAEANAVAAAWSAVGVN